SAASVDASRPAGRRRVRRGRLAASAIGQSDDRRSRLRSPSRSPITRSFDRRSCFFSVPIRSDSPAGDLSRLRIDRDAAPRRRWLPWAMLVALAVAGAAVYPTARAYLAERRAPEVEIAHATHVVVTAGGSTDLPVLVA